MGRDDEIAPMQKMARQLASKGHRLQMIETMLAANRFERVADFLDQPRVQEELKDLADRAGHRGEEQGVQGGEPDTSRD